MQHGRQQQTELKDGPLMLPQRATLLKKFALALSSRVLMRRNERPWHSIVSLSAHLICIIQMISLISDNKSSWREFIMDFFRTQRRQFFWFWTELFNICC